MRLKRQFILLYILNALMLVCSAFKHESFYLVAAFCVWLDLIVYCILDFSKRVFLFAFLIAFFVFLMGREILDVFELHTIVSPFSNEINKHAECLLLISLISLYAGYWIANRFKVGTNKERRNEKNNQMTLSIRRISSYLFNFTLIFSIVQLLDVGRYMLTHGYLSIYTSYSSSIPYAFLKLADITPISFWIYLSTFPPKKEVNRHSLLFIVYSAMTLLTGKRFAFVAGLLVLFTYYSMRNKINNENERWLNKRIIILCLLALPIGTAAMYLFSRVRFGNSIEDTGLLDAFTDFFYSQGVSINVIKYSKMYQIDPSKRYMFSSIYTFLQKNFIARFLGVVSYSGNTVENAIYGNSLAHAMSYMLYGSRYLSGRGIGSCYIAEAFHDFGYVGVVFINLLYGVIINRFFDFRKKGIYTASISFILLNSLLYAPRGSADGFIADIVDITTWGTIVIVFTISNLLCRSQLTKTGNNQAKTSEENKRISQTYN